MAALGQGDRLVTVQAPRFAMQAPSSWKRTDDADGTVTIAPVGGAGGFGVAYGVVLGIARQDGSGVTDAASLASASAALLQRFVGQGSGLVQTGAATAMQVSGRPAQAVVLRGSSPVADGGTQLTERDWLVTTARPDGDVSYLVFVAPEREFGTMKPVFDAMLGSFRAE